MLKFSPSKVEESRRGLTIPDLILINRKDLTEEMEIGTLKKRDNIKLKAELNEEMEKYLSDLIQISTMMIRN